jgi:hypothetical protein
LLVNPILLIVSLALVLLLLFYCIVHRPKKPVLTLLFILLLIVFLSCTSILNNALTPNQGYLLSGRHWQGLVPFITGIKRPNMEQCEQAFHSYKIIDICLFVAAIAAMIVEVWNILVKPDKKRGG